MQSRPIGRTDDRGSWGDLPATHESRRHRQSPPFCQQVSADSIRPGTHARSEARACDHIPRGTRKTPNSGHHVGQIIHETSAVRRVLVELLPTSRLKKRLRAGSPTAASMLTSLMEYLRELNRQAGRGLLSRKARRGSQDPGPPDFSRDKHSLGLPTASKPDDCGTVSAQPFPPQGGKIASRPRSFPSRKKPTCLTRSDFPTRRPFMPCSRAQNRPKNVRIAFTHIPEPAAQPSDRWPAHAEVR